MSTLGRVLIEIRVGNNQAMIDECECTHMHFLNDKQLSEALQRRLKKSELEIRQLLESYHPSTSNL